MTDIVDDPYLETGYDPLYNRSTL